MIRKLDRRGVAAFEFCLAAVPLFILMFVIFDLARYAITMQSLRALSNAGARAMMINNCYVNAELQKSTPTCSGNYLSAAQMQAIAPFLYSGGLTPTLNIPAATTSPIVVTASQPNFTMLMPIWGTTLNAPSASTNVPF
jgi:Flp pilus assembly protein TadG